MTKSVILTGLRSNNNLQLGNYLGALIPTVEMASIQSKEYQINLFVPDLHSFTTPIIHSELYNRTLHNIKTFAAAGLSLTDPSVRIYRQSYVSAHSELTWIIDCFTGMGEMGRMTQYKEKSSMLTEDRISVGLFNYPVLMAADILLYNAAYVPVGDDQSQHLEYTRDIAIRMNNQFGELFTVPEAVKKQNVFFNREQGLRIRDLQTPTKKMSKSDETGKGVIFLSDDPTLAAKKVMAAATDSLANIQFDFEERPGITNLLQILAVLTKRSQFEVNAEWQGKSQYGDLKKAVAEQVQRLITTFQSALAAVDDKAIVQKLLSDEAEMNIIANDTLLRVQRAVGLRPSI